MEKSEKCALDHASTNVSSISGSKNGRTNREEGDEAAALVRDTPWAFEVDTKAWVHVVQTQLRECISLSVRHGYHFFALLGAVDWLCFEMDLSNKVDGENDSSENGSPDVAACARTRITPSLAEVCQMIVGLFCMYSRSLLTLVRTSGRYRYQGHTEKDLRWPTLAPGEARHESRAEI
jgi:hypothetical protein